MPPAEGELTAVDSVIATPDGRIFVSTCCEPVPGTWFEVVGGQPPAPEACRTATASALAPDGTAHRASSAPRASRSATSIGNVLASADLSDATTYRQPEAVMWLDDDTLAVIELRQPDTGNELRLYTIDAALTRRADRRGRVIGTDLERRAAPRRRRRRRLDPRVPGRPRPTVPIASRRTTPSRWRCVRRRTSTLPGAGRRRLVRRHAHVGRFDDVLHVGGVAFPASSRGPDR